MKTASFTARILRRFLKQESGQTLGLLAVCFTTIVAAAGMALDAGHGYYAYQQLQASTDAAVLAGAGSLPDTTTASANVTSYSSESGDKNVLSSLSNVQISSSFKCLSSVTALNIPCTASTGSTSGSYNAMQVTQTAKIQTWFGALVGVPTFNISATATAAMKGLSAPYNIAVILDATLSQNSTDSNCVVNGAAQTEMYCELNGVQTLLQALYPCKASSTTCSDSGGVATGSVDRVALFTFPTVTYSSSSVDANCTSYPTSTWISQNGGVVGSNGSPGWDNNSTYGGYFSMYGGTGNFKPYTYWPNATTYAFPSSTATSYAPTAATGTYEVTLNLGAGDANGFFSDYRSSDTASSLNQSSLLVQAAGGGASGCGGIATPNYDGDIGTYYAGVLYAAQAALTAEQKANPGSDNAIIILSDGNATAPKASSSPSSSLPAMASTTSGGGSYPSYNKECGQAVTAAQYATSQGTTVYSVAYGSETSGCASDGGTYTPCSTMQLMASGATTSQQSNYFYSDYDQSGSGVDTNCTSTAHPDVTSLAGIFGSIGTTFGRARLIPNSAQ
jgi:hypothetical protein